MTLPILPCGASTLRVDCGCATHQHVADRLRELATSGQISASAIGLITEAEFVLKGLIALCVCSTAMPVVLPSYDQKTRPQT